MRSGATVAVIIPALNEESAIGKVISGIPCWVDDVIVVDNGSTDDTSEVARRHGARVFREPRRGYGSACLTGIARLHDPDVVLFMDGDFSDHPEEAYLLVDPIAYGYADMVIGSRVSGSREPGSLTPQQVFGNWMACKLMELFWSAPFTDLGPFRAISLPALELLDMQDPDYGWTVEMQVKAVRGGLRVKEVPVSYRRRTGESKVSRTLRGVLGAGFKIIGTILLAAAGFMPSRKKEGERVIIFSEGFSDHESEGGSVLTYAHESRQLVLSIAEEVGKRRGASVEFRFRGNQSHFIGQRHGTRVSFVDTASGEPEAEMHRALKDAFRSGMERVVLIRDPFHIATGKLLEDALDALGSADLVLAPANEERLNLVGLNRTCPSLFSQVTGDGTNARDETMEMARHYGLRVTLLNGNDSIGAS